MLRTRSRPSVVPLVLLVLGIPAGLAGQGVGADLDGRFVRDVSFPGAASVPEETLRSVVATRASECRGLLLIPFCWLSDSDVLVKRRRLQEAALPLDELRLRVHYFRVGYRQAAVTAEARPSDGGAAVSFLVQEGPPVLLSRVVVDQGAEEVLSSRDLRRARVPEEGDVLNLDALENTKDALSERLGELGFLDAEVRDSLEVAGDSARLALEVRPGIRSTVRAIEVAGNDHVEESTVVQGLEMDPGVVLTTSLLQRSRRTLHETNLFYEVEVAVPPQEDSAKVVRIRLREAPPRLARIGGGFNTLEFAQVETRFTHYNLWGGGRRLDLRATVGNLLAPQLNDRFIFRNILPDDLAGVDQRPFERPTWQVSAEFAQPAFRGARNVVGLSVFTHRQVIPGVSVDRGYGGDISVTRRLTVGSPLSLIYRYELISVTAGDVFFCVNFGICEPTAVASMRRYNALAPFRLEFHVDRADDLLAPTSGYRGRLDVAHASRWTLSDFRYNRISAEASYYFPFGGEPQHVLGAHLRGGWVAPLASTAEALGIDEAGEALLHPRTRFFAGGARSVRGFAENQLGPRVLTIPRDDLLAEDRCSAGQIADGTCDPSLAPLDAFTPRPLGGTSVLEGSVEYRFPIGTTRGAVFLDGALVGGQLGGFLQDAAGALTPGIGVRFSSPAGPIRIDLGLRPRTITELPVVTERATETGDGVVERQLVLLEDRRRFDPLEGEGWVGRVLGRLALHFSIGEAF